MDSGRGPAEQAEAGRAAGGRAVAAAIGEDLGRQLVGRLCLFVAALCLVGGLLADADPVLRVPAVVVGAGGFALVAVAGLAGWERRRQWQLIVLVLLASGALLGALMAQQA